MEYTKAITVRIKESDYNIISSMANEQETSISNVVRGYIIKHLRNLKEAAAQ